MANPHNAHYVHWKNTRNKNADWFVQYLLTAFQGTKIIIIIQRANDHGPTIASDEYST